MAICNDLWEIVPCLEVKCSSGITNENNFLGEGSESSTKDGEVDQNEFLGVMTAGTAFVPSISGCFSGEEP